MPTHCGKKPNRAVGFESTFLVGTHCSWRINGIRRRTSFCLHSNIWHHSSRSPSGNVELQLRHESHRFWEQKENSRDSHRQWQVAYREADNIRATVAFTQSYFQNSWRCSNKHPNMVPAYKVHQSYKGEGKHWPPAPCAINAVANWRTCADKALCMSRQQATPCIVLL